MPGSLNDNYSEQQCIQIMENQKYEIIDDLADILFPESVPEIHHRLFIIFIKQGGEDEDEDPVYTV